MFGRAGGVFDNSNGGAPAYRLQLKIEKPAA